MLRRAFLLFIFLFSLDALGGSALADKRVALVVGNGTYQNTVPLANPVNDAGDMAEALKSVGFDVILERNVDKRSLEMAMARFGRIAQDADAALFYYAGHGMQYHGTNYLMPIDARLEDEFSVNYELMRIDDVLFALSGARGVRILILDACRDNPLADRLGFRSATRDIVAIRGLARIEAPRGTVIAYATQSNQVAVDGTSRNSPFTAALLREIEEPGVEIAALFRRVSVNVNRATGGRQLPEVSVSMSGDFYLNNRESDTQAWVRLRQTNDIAAFQEFIRQYPNSFLIADAQNRIAALERERNERERSARERAEREQAQREEAIKAAAERERIAALERERIETERLARQRAEREQTQREEAIKAAAERERIATLAREQAEQVAREKARREEVEPAPAAGQPVPSVAPANNSKTASVTPHAEPTPPPQLSASALVLEIKKELKRVGCYAGRLDNNWSTADTKLSIRKFVRLAGLPSTPDEPAVDFLDSIRNRPERVCPLECSAREVEAGGRCMPKTCPSDQQLADNGKCILAAKPKPSSHHASKEGNSGRRCLTLNGRSFCE